jgi:hypothetical protein
MQLKLARRRARKMRVAIAKENVHDARVLSPLDHMQPRAKSPSFSSRPPSVIWTDNNVPVLGLEQLANPEKIRSTLDSPDSVRSG